MIEPLPEALPVNQGPVKRLEANRRTGARAVHLAARRALSAEVLACSPEDNVARNAGRRSSPCLRTSRAAGRLARIGRGPRALGSRVSLPQGDSVASLVVFHLVHEGADEHQTAPADPLEVG